MQRNAVKNSGSPATASAKTSKCGAAKTIGTVYPEKVNRASSSDLLSRTIACQPPNEARLRGMTV